MTRHQHVTGVVLAGGRALRLGGADKAGLPLGPGGDETPMRRILEVFEERFASIVIVTSPGRPAPEGLDGLAGLSVVSDSYPGCGPLGGVHAALAATSTPLAFICACDMPFLSGPLIDHLVSAAGSERPLVPLHNGRPEPLHAVYPASLAPSVSLALEEGVRKMTDFFARVGVDHVDEREYGHLAGALNSFENINTPEDLERAGERLERKSR